MQNINVDVGDSHTCLAFLISYGGNKINLIASAFGFHGSKMDAPFVDTFNQQHLTIRTFILPF